MKRPSNYDKAPHIPVSGKLWRGWESVAHQLSGNTVLVDCYPGVYLGEIREALAPHFDQVFNTLEAFYDSQTILDMVTPDLTGDRVFGYLSRLELAQYFDPDKAERLRSAVSSAQQGGHQRVLVLGPGASFFGTGDLVYADMPRWEIQQRFRNGTVGNLGAANFDDEFARKYKWGYFVDWRVCDRHKKRLKPHYMLDTTTPNDPKLVVGEDYRRGLTEASRRPFRVVPFFDPGPWGGQWMKEVCDLDRDKPNFAWCFDCVPEENSLLLRFEGVDFETPSINLVFQEPQALLGEAVHARFGAEFPIRFDFLDTMGGGNLSLQVHPLTEYIQEKFGMHYTQDESYYMLDAEPGAFVYLGLKDGVDPKAMISELKEAQAGGAPFDADKHTQNWPIRKHDHVLIPAGTVHCSGAGSMVLEVSSTPYIFTFKLWDWGRMGMDGKPRPIHLDHGANVIQWDRTTTWTRENLVNRIEPLGSGPGWREERTGLHEREFIETRRHWFTEAVEHNTNGGVHVLNLVEGDRVVVESPNGAFDPYEVHYAETFIVPAQAGAYTIRPAGEAKEYGTLKAYVRT